MADNKDLATEGAADELEGTADVIKGRVRNAVGGATGKTGEQLKGKAEELGGKAKRPVRVCGGGSRSPEWTAPRSGLAASDQRNEMSGISGWLLMPFSHPQSKSYKLLIYNIVHHLTSSRLSYPDRGR